VCGRCYEVPEEMRDEVAAAVPAARSETSWGTPALDLGAGITDQLVASGVDVVHVEGCTLEDERFPSYRRDGERAGRFAGLVWLS
jgi:copper oxidase (laccase) domain-containing protein